MKLVKLIDLAEGTRFTLFNKNNPPFKWGEEPLNKCAQPPTLVVGALVGAETVLCSGIPLWGHLLIQVG